MTDTRTAILSSAVCMAVAGWALGATRTWQGDATETEATTAGLAQNSWQLDANWDTIPANTTYTDTARFNIADPSTVLQPILTSSRSINRLQFDTAGWTLGSSNSTYLLTIGYGYLASSGSGTNTISANVKASDGSQTFTVNTGNTLLISGNVDAASFSIIKNGVGTMRLTGQYLYQGNTVATESRVLRASAGMLELGVNTNLPPRVHVTGTGTIKLLADNQFSTAYTTNYVVVEQTGLLDLNGYSSTTRRLYVGSLAATSVGGGGGGTIDLRTGTLNATALKMLGGTITGTAGSSLALSGGIETEGSATSSTIGGAGLTLTSVNTVVVADGAAGIDLSITAPITTTLGLVKDGLGTLQLTADSSYSGTTSIDAGTLLANNTSGSATGAGAVTIASGATLGGAGALGTGGVTVDGTIAPGNSIGSIDLLGDGIINGTYLLEADVGGASDAVNVTGLLTLGGASILDLDESSALDPAKVYTIATYGSLSGAFFSVDTQITATHEVDYLTGNAVRLVPIPEPATLASLFTCGLLTLRRRRQ